MAPSRCGDPRAKPGLRRYAVVHALAEVAAIAASSYASWLLESPGGTHSPGMFRSVVVPESLCCIRGRWYGADLIGSCVSQTLVLVGGLEHNMCSSILVAALVAVLCCRCRVLGTYAMLCAVGCCLSTIQLLGILLLLEDEPGGGIGRWVVQLQKFIRQVPTDNYDVTVAGSRQGSRASSKTPHRQPGQQVLLETPLCPALGVRLLASCWSAQDYCHSVPSV